MGELAVEKVAVLVAGRNPKKGCRRMQVADVGKKRERDNSDLFPRIKPNVSKQFLTG